jgi:adenylate cyclase
MSAPILLGLRLLAAITLYAFLGWSLYLMWRTLQAQIEYVSAQQKASIKLGLFNSENIFEFSETTELFIGREPECALQLEDITVSARHTHLSFHHGHWWAEDCGSKNGTRLNESLLTLATIITNGDTITCGNTTINVILPE